METDRRPLSVIDAQANQTQEDKALGALLVALVEAGSAATILGAAAKRKRIPMALAVPVIGTVSLSVGIAGFLLHGRNVE